MNYTQSPGCNVLIGQKTSDGEGSQGAIQTKSCHRTRASERRRPHLFVRVSKARFNKKKLPPHPSLTRATIVSYTPLPQPTLRVTLYKTQAEGLSQQFLWYLFPTHLRPVTPSVFLFPVRHSPLEGHVL